MVDAVVRITVVAVLGLALLNVAQAAWLGLRLGRKATQRFPRLGVRVWLPMFGSVAEAREWLAAWRCLMTSLDPGLVAIRAEVRVVATRYLMLMIGANVWSLAVWTILLPSLV